MDGTEAYSDPAPFDLILVIAIASVSMALALANVSNTVFRAVFTLPLALLLPGYALAAATFPQRSIGFAERALFSLGLSLAVTVLGGIALNWTPWGLQAHSWAILLGVVTIGASAVALVRRWARSAARLSSLGHATGPHRALVVALALLGAKSAAYPRTVWRRIARIGLSGRQALLLGLAVVVLGGAVAVARIGAIQQQQAAGFTQLWALPANAPGQQHAMRLGVKNMEATITTYQVAIVVNGKVAMKLPSVRLAPQHTWETTVTLPPGLPANTFVEVALYRADAPDTIYRHVDLWLT